MKQRARRIYDLQHATGATIQGVRLSLKAEASAQLAGIAAVPRFLSSTLLLLAVVGTFAGMKTALPQLTEAISFTDHTAAPGAAQGGPTVDRDAIRLALTEIANAFGANFLALIGALCLGIVAFGAGTERRQLLASLEAFSERHLFPKLPSGADTTAIERLVLELKTSIGEIVATGSSIGDLRGAIEGFQHTLTQSLGSMQAAFTGQFQRDLLRIQREAAVHNQEMTQGVAEIAKALGATTVVYQGLVEGLRERDYGLGRAAAANIAAAETLSQANERISDQIRTAAERLAGTGTHIEALGRAMGERTLALEQAYERSSATLRADAAELRASATSIAKAVESLGQETTGIRQELRAGNTSAIDGFRHLAGSIERGTGEAVVAAREAGGAAANAVEAGIAKLHEATKESDAKAAAANDLLAVIGQRIVAAGEAFAKDRTETVAIVRQAVAAQEAQATELAGMRRDLSRLAAALELRVPGQRPTLTVGIAPVPTNGDAAGPSGA